MIEEPIAFRAAAARGHPTPLRLRENGTADPLDVHGPVGRFNVYANFRHPPDRQDCRAGRVREVEAEAAMRTRLVDGRTAVLLTPAEPRRL
jgi:hypothetical protein